MDHASFDRIVRLLGGTASRRGIGIGIGAALAAIAGGAVTPAAETRNQRGDARTPGASSRKPKPAGPCGSGKVADNRCRKDSECCTNICKLKNKGKDGSGRCRCQRKNKPCTEDRNCCSAAGQQMTCISGHCGFPGPKRKPVATGAACDPLTDTCAASAAACVPYSAGNPSGTYCLLPNGAACSAAGDCQTKDCTGGVCAPEVCDVCASGCPYATVAAAIGAKNVGDVIRIDTGTYSEDLVVAKGLTLSNCNGSAVTLRNATAGSRAIDADLSATPTQTLQIHNLTVTSSSGTGNVGGGIACAGNLILSGTTNVTGCKAPTGGGGGVKLGDYVNPYLMTMLDTAAVTGNESGGYPEGGGIYIEGASRLEMRGRSALRNNHSLGGGGGLLTVYGGSVALYDDVEITGNTADTYAGGAYVYGGSDFPHSLEMHGNARIWGNTGKTGAGGVYYYNADVVLMADNASIDGNTSGVDGGGIFFDSTGITLLMSGHSTITGNTANGTAPSGGGIVKGKVFLFESASITGNTPDQCKDSIGC